MKEKFKKLNQVFKKKKVDALLITSEENRFYLSGFTGSAGCLFITPKQRYILSDFRYWEQISKECKGFNLIKIDRDGQFDGIRGILKKFPRIKKVGFEDDKVSFAGYKKLKKELSKVKLIPLEGAVTQLREIKSKEEIQYIKKAADIANKALANVLKVIKPGVTEKFVASLLQMEMKMLGAEKESFDIIVASGPNGALPHAKPGNRKIRKDDLIVIDFGAKYNGYCSDMTRTICLGKKSPKQKKIYDIVARAQKAALDYIKSGRVCGDVDNKARGLIEKEGYGKEFGHGLGHGIGIEVHESPSFRPNVKDVLRPGMILSVEPGIYLSGFAGVRIEDLVLITKDGYENLTKNSKK
ncbi:MAG: Xaa-Pro peptidase family protein [Armatimonadota bacterium]